MSGIENTQWFDRIELSDILAALAFLSSLVLFLINRVYVRRKERLAAHEQVYDEACFLLEYPFKKQKLAAKAIQYSNEDKELERAVRLYVDAHELSRIYGQGRYVPEHITDEQQRHDYIMRVMTEAHKFRQEGIRHSFDLSLPQLSPVQYLEDPEVSAKFAHVVRHVGRHLSKFSRAIRHDWEDAKTKDPSDVIAQYQSCLDVCPHFFEHNSRGFDDPYFDLPNRIRQEYRDLSMTQRERWSEWYFNHTRWLPLRLRYPRYLVPLRVRYPMWPIRLRSWMQYKRLEFRIWHEERQDQDG